VGSTQPRCAQQNGKDGDQRPQRLAYGFHGGGYQIGALPLIRINQRNPLTR
jgi:hypothetical protein